MLLLVGVTIIILISCLILHYKKHFICQCTRPKANTSRFSLPVGTKITHTRSRLDTITSPRSEPKYRCIFTSACDEDFDFFPIAFFFYLIFLTFICVIIVVKCFIFDAYYDNDFGTYFINSYHKHFISLTTHDSTSIFGNHNIHVIDILDWILVYSIMIVAIWESLFSFYRYYTTLYSTTKYYRPSSSSVFKKFAVYAVIFVIVFIAEIYFTYWMFPIVVLLHSTFNVYCTLKFASLLIQKYRIFITLGSSDLNKSNDEHILKSVYFMRKTSLICTLNQTLCLSLFVISYNIDIIYYLPIFWGISTLIFTLNFVRNRQSVVDFVYAIFWSCRYSKCCLAIDDYFNEKRAKRRKSNLAFIADTIKSSNLNNNNKIKATPTPNRSLKSSLDQMAGLKIAIKLNKITAKKPTKNHMHQNHHNIIDSDSNVNSPPTPSVNDIYMTPNNMPMRLSLKSSPSCPVSVERNSIIHLPAKNPNITSSQSAKKNIISPPRKGKGKKSNKKAFAILGLMEDHSISNSILNPSPIMPPHKRAQTNVNFDDVKLQTINETPHTRAQIAHAHGHVYKSDHRKLDLNSLSVPLPDENTKAVKFTPDTVSIQEEQDNMFGDAVMTLGDAFKNSSSNKKNKLSSPATPLIFDHVVHSMPTPLIKIGDNNNMNELIENEVIFAQDEMDGMVYIADDLKTEKTPIDNNNNNKEKDIWEEKQTQANHSLNINETKSNSNVPNLKIKIANIDAHKGRKHISKSGTLSTLSKLARIGRMTPSIDRRSINLEDVVKSLEILVDYGFCSRKSVNNIKQIQLYRDQYLLDIPSNNNPITPITNMEQQSL